MEIDSFRYLELIIHNSMDNLSPQNLKAILHSKRGIFITWKNAV